MMRNINKTFILIEAVLAAAVAVLATMMIRENTRGDLGKVSVIVQDSDDNQWTAFKYGLRMAAVDQRIEMFVVGTEGMMTAEEQEKIIYQEIDNGADAVIVQPVAGKDTEAMLARVENRVPVMLVGSDAASDGGESGLPSVKPDNYALGKALAEEVLKDYAGNLEGKTLGIVSETDAVEASVNRRRGFEDVMNDTGVRTIWSVTGSFGEERGNSLGALPEADLVAALDDNSLTAAGECSASNNLHGAVVYGIGNSTEAVYYLDTGRVECLVVPDEFNVGYQSLTEMAGRLKNPFRGLKDRKVSGTVIRREELFTEENQDILFTMSQ